jgi:hypothetical protein
MNPDIASPNDSMAFDISGSDLEIFLGGGGGHMFHLQ